jgi:hypothetical protein
MVDRQNNALINFTATGGAQFLLTNVEVSHQLDRELLLSQARAALTPSIIQAVFGDQDAAGFDIDAGQGTDVISFSSEVVPAAGDPFIWTDSDGIDRTAAGRFVQAEALQEAARTVTADSENPIDVSWGPLGDEFGTFPATIQSLTTRHPRDDPSRFTVDIDLRRTDPGNPVDELPP